MIFSNTDSLRFGVNNMTAEYRFGIQYTIASKASFQCLVLLRLQWHEKLQH